MSHASSSCSDTEAASPRSALKNAAIRLRAWFAAQSPWLRAAVLGGIVIALAGGIYAFLLMREQAALEREIESMTIPGASGEGVWSFDDALPVVFGNGSMLRFVEGGPVERVAVVYERLGEGRAEHFVLIQSAGRHHAYYPSDTEMKVFADKAAAAPWGSKLVFVPRGELSPAAVKAFEALDRRFAAARPNSGRDAWKADAGAALTLALVVGLLAFFYVQFGGQFKSLKFVEPAQIDGSIEDLVGMDDIKTEVAQIVDQYRRRSTYAEYGIRKPFNVMFSGPAGTGKTRLASFLAKELRLPILFHSAANLETGYVAGGSNTLSRIVAMARRRRRCIVFLDEAQDLFMKRGGRRKFDDDTANTLLALLDGVRSRDDAEIVWIVASNFNSETMAMDEAMLRRFQMKVDFRLPNREERLAIVRHYLGQRSGKVLPDLDLRHLAEVTEGCSPADIETIVNQAGINAVQTSEMIGADTLMRAAERVLVGNVNAKTTEERERDRRIVAVHEWGHFLVDFERERELAGGDWSRILADMRTIKISLKANPRNNALGFVFHKQGANLLKSKADIEHDVRVLLGGMANEELFFGEEGTTNGAHNDISRVTRLLHHAVAEMGMYRKTRLNFGALSQDHATARPLDEETRAVMEAQSERLYGETKAVLQRYRGLTEHLVGRLLEAGEMGLGEALEEIRRFEAA